MNTENNTDKTTPKLTTAVTLKKGRSIHDATAREWHLIWLEIMRAFKVSLKEDRSEEREKKFNERYKKALRWFRANGPKIEYGGMRYSTI